MLFRSLIASFALTACVINGHEGEHHHKEHDHHGKLIKRNLPNGHEFEHPHKEPEWEHRRIEPEWEHRHLEPEFEHRRDGHEVEHHPGRPHKRNFQPEEISRSFHTCQSQVDNYGPPFETACQQNQPEVLINALVVIRTSLVTLSAHVHAGVGVWVSADLNIFVNLYVNLLAKIQVLLEIIHSHNMVDSCQGPINNLGVPLNALLSVFVGAGIDVRALLGVHVDLNLLGLIGISLNLNIAVGVNLDL